MTGEEVLIAVGLGAPMVGTLAALLFGWSELGRRIVQGMALVSAAAWAGLLATSSVVSLGGFHAGPLVASAACGAALLMLSVDWEREAGRWALAASSLSLVFLQAGLAGGSRGGHGGAVVGGFAAAALCTLAVSWDSRRVAGVIAPPAAAIGIGATAAGFVLVHDKAGTWLLPAVGSGTVPRSAVIALLVGAAALCIGGGLRPGRSPVLLLAGGLAVGLRAGPLLGLSASVAPAAPGTSEGLAGMVLVLGVLGVIAALLRKPPLAIGLLALAVAAGPLRLLPASRLLAAAAVLALAIDRAPAWLLLVPGAAALVVGALDAGSALAVTCVGAAAIVGAVLAGSQLFDGDATRSAQIERRPFEVFWLPALLAGAWLLLAPSRWTWAGAQELRYYDAGAARACAAGLIAAVLAVAWWSRAPRAAERAEPPERFTVEPELVSRPEPGVPELVRSERSAP